jgi:hypothetical protein
MEVDEIEVVEMEVDKWVVDEMEVDKRKVDEMEVLEINKMEIEEMGVDEIVVEEVVIEEMEVDKRTLQKMSRRQSLSFVLKRKLFFGVLFAPLSTSNFKTLGCLRSDPPPPFLTYILRRMECPREEKPRPTWPMLFRCR